MTAALTGMAGAGKTALALHWAWNAAERFPDGQLYVNLRGHDPSGSPVSAAEAVGWLLAGLVTRPERIPAQEQARAGLYRTLLARRRMLIVLDNARDAAQVRPLLVGGPGCMVVVTSRSSLAGLAASEGTTLIRVDPLEPDAAWQMLAARLGPEQLAAHPRASAELIDACSGLPLALAIVTAKALASDLSMEALASQLRGDAGRLAALDTGEPATSVTAVFSWSLDGLSEAAARMFALLAVHRGPDISGPAAASLAAVAPGAADRALAELSQASLIRQHMPGRFMVHDLLRSFAAECAGSYLTDPAQQEAARRVIDHYVQSATAVSHGYPIMTVAARRPGVTPERFSDADSSITWLRAEQSVLLRVVEQAVDHDQAQASWQIFIMLALVLAQQGRWSDWESLGQIALTAATRAHDHEGLGRIHRSLAMRAQMLRTAAEADFHNRKSLENFELAGDLLGQAHAHISIAQASQWFSYDQSSPTEPSPAESAVTGSRNSLGHAELAAELFRQVGDQHGEGMALTWLAEHYSRIGRHEQAKQCATTAIELQRRAGQPGGLIHAWHVLGLVHRRQGDLGEAVRCYEQALSLDTGLSPRQHWYRALVLTDLGDALSARGDHSGSIEAWKNAALAMEAIGHPHAAKLRARVQRASEVVRLGPLGRHRECEG